MLFLMGFVTGILQNPEFSLVVDPAPADPMITDTFIELATAFAIQPCEQISRRFVIVVIICAFVGGGGGSSSSGEGGGEGGEGGEGGGGGEGRGGGGRRGLRLISTFSALIQVQEDDQRTK